MRFSLNRLPPEAPCRPDERGWTLIDGSGGRWGYLWAGATGLLVAAALFSVIILVALRRGGGSPATPTANDPFPWAAILTAPLLALLAHEALHLVWHPDHGLSSRSVVLLWPRRLRFGVYYAGCLSRGRWLLMRLAPLFFLALLPAVPLALGGTSLSYAWETFLLLLIVVNSVGSGGDLVAAWLVGRRVPAGAYLCFCNGRAYYHRAEEEGVVRGND